MDESRRIGTLAAIAVGGAAGATLRTALVAAFPADPGSWPWITFAANLAGVTILAAASVLLAEAGARWLVGPGFCGALTTFSTMQLEVIDLVESDRVILAATYALVSVLAGLVLARGAIVLAGRRQVSSAAGRQV